MTKPRWLQTPDDLPKSAAKYWDFYASGLRRKGRLTSRNVLQFRQLCLLAGTIDDAAGAIGADTIKRGRGRGRSGSSSGVSVLLTAQKQLAALLEAFRLNRPDIGPWL